MARKTKRRTGLKSRRSIKRSIKRYLEKSLRKKSLNKFNKRINKRKKKKTKKKKIQRGGSQGGEEERVALIIQSLEAMNLPQNEGALDKLKKSLGKSKTSLKNPDEEGSSNRRANGDNTTIAFKTYKKTLSQINDPETLTLLYYAKIIIMIIDTLHIGIIPENIKDLFIVLLKDEEFNQIYIPFILYIFANVYKKKTENRKVLEELMKIPEVIEYFTGLTDESNITDVISLIEDKLDVLGDNLGRATRKVRQLLINGNIFNIEELGKPVAVPAAVPAAAVPAAAGAAAVSQEPVVGTGETPAGSDAPEEECTLPEKVAKLSRELEVCKNKQKESDAAFEKAKAEAAAAEEAKTAASAQVTSIQNELTESEKKVRDLESKLEAAEEAREAAREAAREEAQRAQAATAQAGTEQAEAQAAAQRAEAAAQAAQAAEAREEGLREQLEEERDKSTDLEKKLREAEVAARRAAAAAQAAEAQAAAEQAGAQAGEAQLQELNQRIESLLKNKACSTIAEIIIDCKIIEDEAAGEAAEVGLPEKKYNLDKDTPLKYIKLAVKFISKALQYGDGVTKLYKGVGLAAEDVELISKAIDSLLNYIYEGYEILIEPVKIDAIRLLSEDAEDLE